MLCTYRDILIINQKILKTKSGSWKKNFSWYFWWNWTLNYYSVNTYKCFFYFICCHFIRITISTKYTSKIMNLTKYSNKQISLFSLLSLKTGKKVLKNCSQKNYWKKWSKKIKKFPKNNGIFNYLFFPKFNWIFQLKMSSFFILFKILLQY